MPKIHPREELVGAAETAIRNAVHDATEKLTEGETLRVLASVLCNEVGRIARHRIRIERHGLADKPGGLA